MAPVAPTAKPPRATAIASAIWVGRVMAES